MEFTKGMLWHPQLSDPKGDRSARNRNRARLGHEQRTKAGGITMVIDKGIGSNAYADFLETASPYVDCIKFGFGTAVLYSDELLLCKTALARNHGIAVMTGGTLLETAVQQGVVSSFFDSICKLGFTAVEVSDGTIELPRHRRTELIKEGVRRGLRVFTEYGKKLEGSLIQIPELIRTFEQDREAGAELLTIEARESGMGVGLFDREGKCRRDTLESVAACLPEQHILWEAPLKSQQVELITSFGANVNLGNIVPGDAITLEAMRRGLRSDTFPSPSVSEEAIVYMI